MKIATLLSMILGIFLIATGLEKVDPPSGLYVVKVNGKYGFIDHSGKIVIPPTYDHALDFQGGLSMVSVGEKCGFIDLTGKPVIEPRFEDCMPFAEEMAAVQVGKKWGYIDKAGKIVIEPQFEHTIVFSEGLAFVELGDTSGFIDKTGKMVFKTEGLGSWFSEQLAAVSNADESKTFFIDHTGKKAFPAIFESAGPFSEGLASVSNKDKNGFIDRTGKVVIPFKSWGPWGGFSEGLAVVFVGQGRAEYIDKTGKEAITGDFVRAEPFSEGFAAVMIKTGKDTVTSAETQKSSIVMIKSGAKYGYIDKTGTVVIPAQFAKAGKFVGGLAQVCMESTAPFDFSGQKQPCGYIDKTGKMIWQPSM